MDIKKTHQNGVFFVYTVKNLAEIVGFEPTRG